MNVKSKMRSVVYFVKRCNNVSKVFHNENTFRGLHTFHKQKLGTFNNNSKHLMENHVEKCLLWDTEEILNCSSNHKHAIIVLNRPINCEQSFVKNIWKKAQISITVDGGTDRWLTFLEAEKNGVFKGTNREYLPDIVTGDMDSIREETLLKFKTLGVKIVRTMDQNKTDYTKALEELDLHCREKDIKVKIIYVFAETSGRMDQIIAGISTLYKSQKILPDAQIIHISKSSLTWLLRAGMHKIMIPDILRKCKSWCSLLPVGYPVESITTTGLRWNLDNQRLELEGIVSSSNTYADEPCVTVNTDTPVIWSMGIKPIMNNGKRKNNEDKK